MLVVRVRVCAQSEPPAPITAADADGRAAAGGSSNAVPSVVATPASGGAIAESPSVVPHVGPATRAASNVPASSIPPAEGAELGASRAADVNTPAVGRSGVLKGPQLPSGSTQVIPQAAASSSSQAEGQIASPEPSTFSNSNDIKSYEANQDLDAQLGTLREFVAQGTETSEIGAELVEAQRKLDSGQVAEGLLIVKVLDGSPAAKAGLRPFSHAAHSVMTGAVLAAALICPPAILALPMLNYTQVGESYDMIIGIDGVRVTNFIDFEDQMRKTRPGEIVYLTVIRDGRRVQMKVPIPATTQSALR